MFTEKFNSVINVSFPGQWGGWVKSSALIIFARQQSLAKLLDGEHYESFHLIGGGTYPLILAFKIMLGPKLVISLTLLSTTDNLETHLESSSGL